MTEAKDFNENNNSNDSFTVDGEGTESQETDEEKRIRAAGVTGAMVGMLAGPIGSVVLGFSAAYAAEQKEGPLGNTARSLGDFGLSTQKRVVELADKHHVSKRSTEVYAKATEYDRIKVIETTTNFAKNGWKSTSDFCEENKVVQKGKDIIGKNVCNVLEKVVGGKDKAVAPTVY